MNSQTGTNLVIEAIYLKAASLQKIGKANDTAQECNSLLDAAEKMFQNGAPELLADLKLQETIGKAVELLPELWKQAGNIEESLAAYRRALRNQWNLDNESYARIKKRFVVLLLYGGFARRGLLARKEPFVESEMVKDDLLEPSLHKYVTVRDTKWDLEPQESAGNILTICVKMLGLNSKDKTNPTPCSQGARCYAADGFDPNSKDYFDPNLKRLIEVVQTLDKVSPRNSTSLHLLESTKQEQQRELYQARETGSLPRNILIGRDKDQQFVMQWLMKPFYEHSGTDSYINISLLSIVGHDGMGKTTPLQHVCEAEKKEELDLKIWVCVSNNFNVKNVIADVLESLKVNRTPLDALCALQDETYLLQLTFASTPLVQFNDSKAETSHLDWGKPLHVVIWKSTFKVFDPGI